MSRAPKASAKGSATKPATFEVDEDTLIYAFRYALGRRSTAPSHMVAQLTRHWPCIATWSQAQIHREIAAAIARGDAGRECDVETWRKVLGLRLS